MLKVENLSRSFGGVLALTEVDIDIPQGQLRGLIGPNGAGKSTLFHLISGHHLPTSGRIKFNGSDIADLPPSQRATRGISLVFQGARLFHGMSVLENVMVGAHTWAGYGVINSLLRTPGFRATELEIARAAREALEKVDLLSLESSRAELLPLGQQRRLQVARALCSRPKLLLLDEPASGLRDEERRRLMRLIRNLNAMGITIVLVEHDVSFVMDLCDRITVLELGRVIAEGSPAEVRNHSRVIEAYLGRGTAS